jgi:hypothetical protein
MAEDRTEDDLTMPVPDIGELLQEPVDIPTVPVSVELGTVYRLPARRAVYSTDVLPSGAASICVAAANPKRNRLVLIADQPVYLARDTLSLGAWWPADVAYVAEHCDAVCAKSAGEEDATVGVVTELWAD